MLNNKFAPIKEDEAEDNKSPQVIKKCVFDYSEPTNLNQIFDKDTSDKQKALDQITSEFMNFSKEDVDALTSQNEDLK